jgi:hypothetical protein
VCLDCTEPVARSIWIHPADSRTGSNLWTFRADMLDSEANVSVLAVQLVLPCLA